MSLTPNQNISLTDALSFFPKFEGNPSELIDFLNCCKEAKSVLPEAAEGNLTKLIYGSKLGAKVKTSLNIAVPVTIAGLTSELKKIYVPNKTLFQLQGELGRMYQKDTESVVEFVNRLRKKGREIMDGEKFPFRQANRVENGVMYIPPRSESTFFIEVQNPEVREGFIPKLRICKGVFAGNCLVRINNMNRAYLQIYNTTEEEVAVKIPNLAVREIEQVMTLDLSSKNPYNRLSITKPIFNNNQNIPDFDRFER
ncbi:Protein of unknown function, partial [Cotesia congregata]